MYCMCKMTQLYIIFNMVMNGDPYMLILHPISYIIYNILALEQYTVSRNTGEGFV